LRRVPLLSLLAESQLNHLQKSLRITCLAEGERVFDQGQAVDRLFFVRAGQIKQFRVSTDGNERVVDIVQPWELIGENLLFMQNPAYPFSAEALTNAEVISFDSGKFVGILGESVDTCFRLMSDMSMKIHNYLEQVDYLTMQNAGFRLVDYLLKQIPGSHDDNSPYTIQLAAPKSVIASWLSIQPETLSRQLRALRAQDLIQVQGKSITINDIDQLRKIVA
jgi:CRP-like cAMP-binding protein